MNNIAQYDRVYSGGLYDVSSVYDHIVRIRQRYLPAGGRALDHGFGNGVIAAYLAGEGFDVCGVETSRAAVEIAHRRGLGADSFALIDEVFPFPDDSFDVVVSNQVLYFITDRAGIDRALGEIRRVLKPGGKLACTVMAPENYYFDGLGYGSVEVRLRGRIDRDWTLYRFRDEAELRDAFSDFEIDDLGYFDFRLLDVKCAKHWIVLARKPEARHARPGRSGSARA